MLDDVFILKKIKNGDIKTFEQIFHQYYRPLYLYAFSITGKKEPSEEIVQELFYVLWKNRDTLNILKSLKAYLYKSVRNQALQYCEHQNIRNLHRENVLNSQNETQEDTPQKQMEYNELQDIVNHTLEKLPDRRLKIFKMHRIEGRKYKEIAELLSISIKTVEAEMTKAYQILREEVEKYTHAS